MDSNIKEGIKQLFPEKKGVFKSMLHAFLPFFLMIISGILAVWSWEYTYWLSVPMTMLAIVINGTRFREINNMSHECLHRSYTRNHRLNDIFGHLFAVAEFSSFKRVRRGHATHHAFLGNMKKDGDLGHLEEYHFERSINSNVLFEHFARAFTLRFWRKYVFFVVFDHEDPAWATLVRFLYLSLLTILLFLFPIEMVTFFFLPYFTTYQIHKYLLDFLDHGGLLDPAENEVNKSRNLIIKNSILRYLIFPRNDCYHLIHHLFPSLPIETFQDAHRIMLNDEAYRLRKHTALQQFSAWFKGNLGETI